MKTFVQWLIITKPELFSELCDEWLGDDDSS